MKTLKLSLGAAALVALTGCMNTPPPQANSAATDAFIADYYAKRGITEQTHGSFATIARFTAADVPRALPKRGSAWAGNGVEMLALHSQGHSQVSVLYPVNVDRTYSASGRGAPVPVEVRIDPPADPSAKYPRDKFKRVSVDTKYSFSGRLWNKVNKDTAIRMTREVLSKTHCRGGTVTENRVDGEFATAYAPRNRAGPNGQEVAPGWIVRYTCSRWRAR